MPGYEIIGIEEKKAVDEVFDNGACLFRYGFESMRNNIFKVLEFEKKFTQYLKIGFAQATTSGTASLFAINRILDIGPGDEVITQSFTFVATVEAILETGATPIITEVDKTLNMDPYDLERKITKRTKAIWVVHMLGVPAQMDKIKKIAEKHKLLLLEDNCQALGAKFGGKLTGTIGKMNAFSFDFGKTLTTGDGGMIVTNDSKLKFKAKSYCDHGHEDNPSVPRGEDTATKSGFNFRMMELQAAVGIVQLKKLPQALKTVKSNYLKLKKLLSDIPEIEFRHVPEKAEEVGDSLIFFIKTKAKREIVSEYLASKGIGFKLLPGAVKWHFAGRWDHIWRNHPLYKEKKYLSLWPNSLNLLERAIAIPVMIKMNDNQIATIAREIINGVNKIKV